MQGLRSLAVVLLLVGGVLALVDGLRPLVRGFRIDDVDLALLVLAGAVGIVGSLRGSRGATRDAAVLGIAGGVLALVAGADLAGAVLLIGGALDLVK